MTSRNKKLQSLHNPKNSPQKGESHPVFSDFAYIPNVEGLSFAVGLREEDGDDDVIHRILPLRKIIPKIVTEKKLNKKVVVEESCNRPDCAARRERLDECHSENEHLRAQLKAIENRVIGSKNKLAIMEKSISIAEEKNESVRGLIDETQARISSLEVEVGRGENANETLRNKLSGLQREIELLKQQTDEHSSVMQSMSNKAIQEVIFSNRKHGDKDTENESFAIEVSKLRFIDKNQAYDSDDDY